MKQSDCFFEINQVDFSNVTVYRSSNYKEGYQDSYYISRKNSDEDPIGEFGFINFQTGSVKDNGSNGCNVDDIINICMHRLNELQTTEKCKYNEAIISKLNDALDIFKVKHFEKFNGYVNKLF